MEHGEEGRPFLRHQPGHVDMDDQSGHHHHDGGIVQRDRPLDQPQRPQVKTHDESGWDDQQDADGNHPGKDFLSRIIDSLFRKPNSLSQNLQRLEDHPFEIIPVHPQVIDIKFSKVGSYAENSVDHQDAAPENPDRDMKIEKVGSAVE